MITQQYVWFAWSIAFLIPWAGLFLAFPSHRHTMLWVSLLTMPFGLTEPIFVPEYWNPPSLFNLAQTTGFDIESLIFCFGIGGVGSELYSMITGRNTAPMNPGELRLPLHRHHYKALAFPLVIFPLLYFLPWNPIYPAIVAMISGAVTTILCRPDLITKVWVGGVLFLGYYFLFFLALEVTDPTYVERVWNLPELTGVLFLGIPLEELLFGFAFGLYWSGAYEHVMWWRVPLENIKS